MRVNNKVNYLRVGGDGRSERRYRYDGLPFPQQSKKCLLISPQLNFREPIIENYLLKALDFLGADRLKFCDLSQANIYAETIGSLPKINQKLQSTFDLNTLAERPENRLPQQCSLFRKLKLPGIYMFLEAGSGSVIYIGQSKNDVLVRIYEDCTGGLKMANGSFASNCWTERKLEKKGHDSDAARKLILIGGFEIAAYTYDMGEKPWGVNECQLAETWAKYCEALLLEAYVNRFGKLPPLNQRSPGNGLKKRDPDYMSLVKSLGYEAK